VAETWGALGSLPALLEQAERIGKDRASLEAALEILLGFTRDLAVFRVGGLLGNRFPPTGWRRASRSRRP